MERDKCFETQEQTFERFMKNIEIMNERLKRNGKLRFQIIGRSQGRRLMEKDSYGIGL